MSTQLCRLNNQSINNDHLFTYSFYLIGSVETNKMGVWTRGHTVTIATVSAMAGLASSMMWSSGISTAEQLIWSLNNSTTAEGSICRGHELLNQSTCINVKVKGQGCIKWWLRCSNQNWSKSCTLLLQFCDDDKFIFQYGFNINHLM